MGNCKFCGKSAGFLRSEHSECRNTHEKGKLRIIHLIAGAAVQDDLPPHLMKEVNRSAASSFIKKRDLPAILATGFEHAVDLALDDHLLTEQESQTLDELLKILPVSQSVLNQNGAVTRLVQGNILRDIQEGNISQRINIDGRLPFNLQKSETLVWVFQDVKYLEDKTRSQFVGGSHGMSFRVAKGVYYRTGSFKGRRVETTETTHVDTGLMGITSKHVYFSGASKRFRIRYDRIVTFEPYSDGIGLMRDAQTAKSQTFITDEGWFTYNLISSLAQA